jgi:EAL domain-containing protein (putative c-di-GMP-specific phosphodiesterase class I)
VWTQAQPVLESPEPPVPAAADRRPNELGSFRRALCSEEIVVHFQPIVSVKDLRVRGAEALVRWEHPKLGLLSPRSFMQAVERTAETAPLTHYVLERSIAECAGWRARGRDLSVAVNLSARNLLDYTLPREIAWMLRHHGLSPEALQLEITESMIMSEPDRALSTAMRLKELGVRLSVDDFGTGHFSLSNLKRLPIDELKIDRSFVSPMTRDLSDRVIVRSTINLGHDLGLSVAAEGVEDEATLGQLARMNCDLAQGSHLSAPIPGHEFGLWLDAQPQWGAAGVPASPEREPVDAAAPARS